MIWLIATSPHTVDPKDIAIIGGRRYYFSPISLSVPNAIPVCTDINMTLAAFETAQEFDAISDHMIYVLAQCH
ncbi:hypothetical protein B566_EDAN018369 [Ephemera danica]|nr:hypothetical protein B566_EDAN018369 [Ephemera danica]